MINYSYTIVYVEDVEKTIAFYVEAFGLVKKFITPEKDYAELETGPTTLAFASYAIADYNGIPLTRADKAAPSQAVELAFVTDDITSAFAQAVAAGAVVVTEPIEKPWGQTIAYVRDINGFLVEVCTAVAT